jgi:hypothetical protein
MHKFVYVCRRMYRFHIRETDFQAGDSDIDKNLCFRNRIRKSSDSELFGCDKV